MPGTKVWCTHFTEMLKKIESLQRRATKIYSLFSLSLGKRLNSNLISSLHEEKVTSTNENVYSRD